ncbi:hypothetical protein [Mucilaginibacter ginkgonis]|uniref:Uncharacterized protein n=1 Tax=Mucilaginibacter ginkgonis TaxID=2682091 RepID=A0A7T7F936_9SPHI|nr:hypothetical protein [Mucilaginibacter ginkgonis]QQL49034.1 hypothetical protein GO620_012705 [Mucilaginibacter ginkgonis]
MKKLLFVLALAASTLTFKQADAQLRVSLNFNIGNQPAWGPTGYDRADYYYLPDIDTYYSVNNHDYVYNNGGQWIHSGSLPARYSNYDLYNGYKVVVNEPNPWLHAATYRTKYAGYRDRRGQAVIRDSRDNKYRNHWNGPGNNGRGNAYGHDRDHGRGHDDHGRGHH